MKTLPFVFILEPSLAFPSATLLSNYFLMRQKGKCIEYIEDSHVIIISISFHLN